MKAIVQDRYGTPEEVLRLQEIAKPQVGDGEVLRYDLILDVASNLSLRACRRVLTPDGVYLVIGHDHFGKARGRVLGSIPRMIGLLLISRFVGHLPASGGDPVPTKAEAMATLAELLETGKLTPVIDRTFPLEEVPQAMAYLESGRACGRIVITA